ncbi:hypothetical protein M427DRAFT_30855 [Gonapodya prolifera JEL478]|uniref:Uncharacterized protein n=1 Tax=Gonapodya prolifera (strain JEL478) TaxID=1344416 RepID=A0A139AJX2_GONPJ|nr:hypothetical protein M427DRAFT_30855 [Gonapodya prolifera JEL478]|eukprot:KXS17059.1 hypothetical protein M427DRAFT_30855 [Gonapodya prolifera JEL478]
MQDRVEVEKLFTLDVGLQEWKLMDMDWNYQEKPLAQALSLVETAAYLTLVMVVPFFNVVTDMLEDADVRLLPVTLTSTNDVP